MCLVQDWLISNAFNEVFGETLMYSILHSFHLLSDILIIFVRYIYQIKAVCRMQE